MTQPDEPDQSFSEVEFVRRLARRLVSDRHLAEDIAQESLLAKLRSAPGVLRSPKAYLATIVRHVVSNQLRSLRRRRQREIENGPRVENDEHEASEAARVVRSALDTLAPHYREAVWLRYAEGLPPREIARRLGVPVETARTRVKRGVVRLRRQIERELDTRHGGWRALLLPLAAPSSREPAALSGAAAVGALGTAGCMLLGALFLGEPERTSHRTPVGTERSALAAAAVDVPSPLPARTDARATTSARTTFEVALLEDGRALEGMQVTAHGAFGTRTARTDARGECAFDLPLDGDARIAVAAEDGTREAVLEIPAGERLARHAIPVASTRSIEGIVLGEDGRPLAGFPLTAWPTRPDADRAPIRFVTDATGSFRAAGMPASFHVAADAAPLDCTRHLQGHDVPPGVHGGLELLASRRRTIGGTVRTPDGMPIAGAAVDVFPTRGRELMAGGHRSIVAKWTRREVLTGEDGAFALEIPAVDAELSVYAGSYRPLALDLRGLGDLPLDLVLERDETVRVRVVDTRSLPVDDAAIVAVRSAVGTSGQLAVRPPLHSTFATDANGVCDIPRAALGQAATLMVTAEGLAPGVVRPARLAASASGVDVVLHPERTVRGRVFIGDRPAPSVPVVVTPWFDAGELERFGIERMFREPEWPGGRGGPWLREATTDAHGWIDLSAPSGELEVRVGPFTDGRPSDGTIRYAQARVSATDDVFEVRLAAEQLRFDIVLPSRANDAPGHVDLVAFSPTLERQVAWSETRERATIGLPPADDWHLFAWREGSAAFATALRDAPQPIRVTLEPGATRVVPIVDADGAPLPEASVLLHDEAGAPVLGRTWASRRSNWIRADRHGRVRLVDVPSAPLRAGVYLPDDPTRREVWLDLREASPRIVVADRRASAPRRSVELVLSDACEGSAGSAFEVRALADDGTRLAAFAATVGAGGLELDLPGPVVAVDVRNPWQTEIRHRLTEPCRQGRWRGVWQRATFAVPQATARIEIAGADREPFALDLEPGADAIVWPAGTR